jgi:septum formation protein
MPNAIHDLTTPISLACPLVLASASPRRSQLLGQAGVPFEILPSDVEELDQPHEQPHELAVRLASEKALAVAYQLGEAPPRWVLGADTIVVRDTAVLGKPVDAAEAVELLGSLVGRRHRVITGFAVINSALLDLHTDWIASEVEMRPAEQPEIEAYVATGEPMDKAGAYALQGKGRRFVQSVEGSESNVIGLPVDQTLALLRKVGALLCAGVEIS